MFRLILIGLVFFLLGVMTNQIAKGNTVTISDSDNATVQTCHVVKAGSKDVWVCH